MCYIDRMDKYINIVKGVRKHNAQAQMMFYDFFVRRVFLSSYSITGDENEAEEIAQDTMLKVFEKPDLLHDDAVAMERILKRIAINAAINVMRRRKDFVFSVDEIPDIEDPEIEEDNLYFSVEEVKKAVTSLSDSYRTILSLRLFGEMSFSGISELLNVKCSTVRVQYMRGITKLKHLLL